MAHEWSADRVGGLAAEVAFFGLLSLFPALLALAGALGSLQSIVGSEVADRAEHEVLAFMERILTSEASGTIDAARDLFADADASAFTIGFIAALWAASRAFLAVIRALDVAYDVEERRRFIRLRAEALGLAIGSLAVGAVLLAMVVLGPLLGTGHDVADAVGLGDGFAAFWDFFRWPVVFVVMVLWAATVLHLGPDHATPLRWDLPGAVLSAVGWVLASVGLRVYLDVAGETNQVLGTLGGSLIVILWLYLLGVALLVGGELNAVLAVRHGVQRHRQ